MMSLDAFDVIFSAFDVALGYGLIERQVWKFRAKYYPSDVGG